MILLDAESLLENAVLSSDTAPGENQSASQCSVWYDFYGQEHYGVYIHVIFYPFICTWMLELLLYLAIMNCGVMKINIQVFLESLLLILWGYLPKCGIIELYGNSMYF